MRVRCSTAEIDCWSLKGICKEIFFSKNRDYYGSGWVGPGLTLHFFFENPPKIALNQYWYFGVVYNVYSVYIVKSCWLLWFECSVHVSDGFQKKFGWGWVSGLRPIHFFWIFFNFARPLTTYPVDHPPCMLPGNESPSPAWSWTSMKQSRCFPGRLVMNLACSSVRWILVTGRTVIWGQGDRNRGHYEIKATWCRNVCGKWTL